MKESLRIWAIEFDFEAPIRSIEQLSDRGALHWVDKFSLSSWERTQPGLLVSCRMRLV
jgi:hypothetical protein